MPDNDACDNQVVQMRLSGGATCTFTFAGSSKRFLARSTIVYGTHGLLRWTDEAVPGSSSSSARQIVHEHFASGQQTVLDSEDVLAAFDFGDTDQQQQQGNKVKMKVNGEWDYYLMHAFVEAVRRGEQRLVPTDLEDSLRSHVLVFAAEHARKHSCVVNVDDFCRQHSLDLF